MTDERKTQSPIFVKTYDFLLWLIPLTLKYPKPQRFLLAERTSQLALEFYELILEAVFTKLEPLNYITQADLLLNKIRLYMRLGFDLKCLSMGQYEYSSKSLDEIGRLLGGWKSKVKRQAV